MIKQEELRKLKHAQPGDILTYKGVEHVVVGIEYDVCKIVRMVRVDPPFRFTWIKEIYV